MYKKFGLILILILILIISWTLLGQITTTLKSGDRLKEATDELHKIEIKNKELKAKIEEVKRGEFLEEQARDKLGLVKEGETLVIIPKDKIDQVLGIAKKIEEIKLPNWQGWLKLFYR